VEIGAKWWVVAFIASKIILNMHTIPLQCRTRCWAKAKWWLGQSNGLMLARINHGD
jgi:hypothetical protein